MLAIHLKEFKENDSLNMQSPIINNLSFETAYNNQSANLQAGLRNVAAVIASSGHLLTTSVTVAALKGVAIHQSSFVAQFE